MRTILETLRIRLREFCVCDVDQVHRIFSEPEVMQYIGDGHAFTREETEVFIEKMMRRYKSDGYSFWAAIDKESESLVGHCGIMRNKECGVPEIGWTIDRSRWREELGYEISAAVINYGFATLELEEIVAFGGLIEKLGMELLKSHAKNGVQYVAYRIGSLKHQVLQ